MECWRHNPRRSNRSNAYKLSCTHAKYKRIKRRQARRSQRANRRAL